MKPIESPTMVPWIKLDQGQPCAERAGVGTHPPRRGLTIVAPILTTQSTTNRHNAQSSFCVVHRPIRLGRGLVLTLLPYSLLGRADHLRRGRRHL